MTSYSEQVTQLDRLMQRHRPALRENLAYYESEHRVKAIGVSTPPEMRKLLAQIGWPRMYVDSVEERLDIEGFRLADSSEADTRLWHWWQANNLDIEAGMGHTEAMVHGRAYITVAAPDPDDPMADQETPSIRVESPRNLFAEIDPVSRKVRRALRMYREPSRPVADQATLLLPDRTVWLVRESGYNPWRVRDELEHGLGVVPVVPLTNRESLADRAGHSEITPELRSITDAAARTMMNLQAAAELMAVPQRLLFGVARDALAANPDDPGQVLEAYFARIIAIEDSEAHAFQFAAAELRNFVDVLQELAKQAASYTGLPPQYLTVSSDNPASAEAIRSSESRLVKKAERKARLFGGAWEAALRLAMLIMDGSIPKAAHRLETLWRDPATPTYASKADAVTKLYNNGSGVIPLERARIDLGYSAEERREMRKWDQQTPTGQLASLYGNVPGKAAQPGDDGKAAA